MEHLSDKDMIGRIALCRNGRLGRITERRGLHWHGMGIYDDQLWQSREPRVLNDENAKMVAATLARFLQQLEL